MKLPDFELDANEPAPPARPAAKADAAVSSRERWIFALVALLALGVRLAFVHEPFDRDEGGYAYIAQEILRGAVPYRDVIDLKPPGVYYLYALALSVCGQSVEAVRVFTAIYSCLTLAVVYALARRVHGAAAAVAAAVLFALFASAPFLEGSSSNTEVFLLLPLLLAVLLFVQAKESGSRALFAASGVAAGLAMLIKTIALPYVALLQLCCFWPWRPAESRQAQLIAAGAFFLPLALMAGLVLAAFAWAGALDDFLYWNVSVPLAYSKGMLVATPGLAFVLDYLAAEILLPVLLGGATAAYLLVRRRRRSEVLTALLLPAACLGVWMPGKYLPHYFIPLQAVLVLLGGIGIAELLERKDRLTWLAGAVVALAFGYFAARDYRYFFTLTAEELAVAKKNESTFVDSTRIAAYLRARTNPGDSVLQWGFEPELYFLTATRAPIPHISTPILAGDRSAAAMNRRLWQGLSTRRPKYVVVQPAWANFPGRKQLAALLGAEYELEASIAYALIYRLK